MVVACFKSRQVWAALAVIAFSAGFSAEVFAGPKCGGGGGSRTRTYSCGTGQYMMGMEAVGGAFVHNIKVQCTDYKLSSKIGGGNPTGPFNSTSGGGSCPNELPVISLQTYCGAYVDSIRNMRCGARQADGTVAQTTRVITINVGGGGGGRKHLECPSGKAIYKVRVKYGAWIDSIEVFCR